MKAKGKTSIVTAVSFDGSSSDAYKIVMRRTDSSTVTLTTLAVVTRAGMNYMQALDLNKMFGINGIKVTEVEKGNGND
jgi:signal transduction protein with GAF and PtsI domain